MEAINRKPKAGGRLNRNKIARLRVEKNLSARELSRLVGASEQMIGSVERGHTFDMLGGSVIALCDVLGIENPRDLYDPT